MSDTSSTDAETHTVAHPTISETDCSICFETITAASGHATLGCAHRFHLMCVVRWFQEQEGPSSCPCCRHEVGTLDNIPLYPEDEEDEDDASDTLSGWTTDSDEDEDEDDDDADSIGSLRRIWTRDPTGGQWEGRWILHRPTVTVWDPTAPITDEAGGEPPEELTEVVTEIQRIWRGYYVRRSLQVPAAPEAHSPFKLPSGWIMDRMMRVD